MKKIISLFLIFVLIITTININANNVYADNDTFFAYRVDVVDSKADSKSRIAIDVASNENGKVYAYAMGVGSETPTADEVKKKGTVTEIVAREEARATAYCYYDYSSVKIGNSYDIYICFEDENGKLYGPYKEKGWVAKYYASGDGTKENPYQIWNYRHLYNTSQLSGTTYVKLMQDIDLSDCPYSGYALCDGTFEGEFDGNHKSIINMYGKLINKLAEGSVVKDTYLVGVNSVTEGKKVVSKCDSTLVDKNYGSIKECAVINSDYDTHNDTYDAGVVCITNYSSGEITKCKVIDCSIICAKGYVGGIVGRNEGIVTDCYFSGKIINSSTVGGVFGGIVGNNIRDTATIDNCYANVDFESDKIKGGIVGQLSSGLVSNCVSNYIPDDALSIVRLSSSNCGSIVGTISSGVSSSNVSNNQGAFVSKPAPDGTPEGIKELENLEKVWDIYHGALSETGTNTLVDPIPEAVIVTQVSNITGMKNDSFSLESYPNYETVDYNTKYAAKLISLDERHIYPGNHDFSTEAGANTAEKCSLCEAKNIAYSGLDIKATTVTYDGTEKTAEITGIDAANYTVTGDKATNAGKHTITLTGKGEYAGTREVEWTISPKELTPSITGAAAKVYDGTTTVPEENTLSISLAGICGEDEVSASATSYAYADKNAAEEKNVVASGITLSGAAKDNYTVATTVTTKVGKITKATPTYTKPTDLTGVCGKALSTVELTGGFEWTDDTTAKLVADSDKSSSTVTKKAKYVPADTTNYVEVEDISIDITVSHDLKAESNSDGTHSGKCQNCSYKATAEDCSGGTATCVKKAECEICGAEYGSYGAHKLKAVAVVPATCKTTGMKAYYVCDRDGCGAKFEDAEGKIKITDEITLVIPKDPTKHGSNTEIKNAKEATCTEAGYTGDTYCKDCGEKIAEGEVIAAKGHTWDAGKVTKQPTVTAEGVKTYTCKNCGDTKTESIAKLPAPKKNEVIEDKTGNDYKVTDPAKKEVTYKAPADKKAKTITIPASVQINGITYKVTKVDDKAFKGNTTVTKVVIPSSVTVIGAEAFSGCKNLTTVSIPKNVTTIGKNAFKGCAKLTKLTLPSKCTKIGAGAFDGCKKMKTITIKSTKLTSKSVSAKAFKGLSKNVTIKVPKKQLKAYKSLLKKKGFKGKVK